MRQRLWQCHCLLLGEKTTRNGAGLDVLSHTKKGKFWRDLVGLFPEVIDYLCNPQIDAVKPPTLLLQSSLYRAVTRGCRPVFVLLCRVIC
jgi:hypothetical protein